MLRFLFKLRLQRTQWNRPECEWDELDCMNPVAREVVIQMRNRWDLIIPKEVYR